MEYHIIATYGDFLKLQIIITELQYPKIFLDDLGGVRRRGGLLLLLKNHKIVVGILFVPLHPVRWHPVRWQAALASGKPRRLP